VIKHYEFGSLLLFDKCFVPNKFVKWVAHIVHYKAGDIAIDGKVISLITKQAVHLVRDLPLVVYLSVLTSLLVNLQTVVQDQLRV
jgi:hypothetical protein